MPKFMYSVIFFLTVSWGSIAYLLFGTTPDGYPNIFVFLFVLTGALGVLLSLPFYFYLKKRSPGFISPNIMYRKAMKSGLFVSFGIAGVFFLKAFNLLSLLNIGLFMLLYLGIFYQLNSKR